MGRYRRVASRIALLPVVSLVASLLPGSPASARQIPVVVTDPFECPNPNGMNGITIWGCQFAVAPKVWRIQPTWQWQSSVPFGALVMVVKHWASWGGFDASATGTVTFYDPVTGSPHVSFTAQVGFTFPVTFQGRLVYAEYNVYPGNGALLKQHPNYALNGLAL
jgi:hypothetical protein